MKLRNSRDLSIEQSPLIYKVRTNVPSTDGSPHSTPLVGTVEWSPFRRKFCFVGQENYHFSAAELSILSEWLTIINATRKRPF